MAASDSEFEDFPGVEDHIRDAITKVLSLTWMDEDDDDFVPVNKTDLNENFEKQHEKISVLSSKSECSKKDSTKYKSKSAEITQNSTETLSNSSQKEGDETSQKRYESKVHNEEGGETSNNHSESHSKNQSQLGNDNNDSDKTKESSSQGSEIVGDSAKMKRKSKERSEASPSKQVFEGPDTSDQNINPLLELELSTSLQQVVAALQESDDDEDFERYDVDTPSSRVNLFSVSTGATPQRTRKWDMTFFSTPQAPRHDTKQLDKSVLSTPKALPLGTIVTDTDSCYGLSPRTPLNSSGALLENSGEAMLTRSAKHCSSIKILRSQSRHSEIVKRMAQRIYTCDICSKQCASKSSVLRHLMSKHMCHVSKTSFFTRLTKVVSESCASSTLPQGTECADIRRSPDSPAHYPECSLNEDAASKAAIAPPVKPKCSSNTQENVSLAKTVTFNTCSRVSKSELILNKKKNSKTQRKKAKNQLENLACRVIVTRLNSKSVAAAVQNSVKSSELEIIKDGAEEGVPSTENFNISETASSSCKVTQSNQSTAVSQGTTQKEDEFKCELCGKQVSSKKGLKIHATRMHKNTHRALIL